MPRTTITAVALAALLATLARSAPADDLKCEGAIVSIDGDTITVKDMTKEHSMKIEPATKITAADKPVMPTDLKVGQKVKCLCDRKDSVLICTTLEIMRDTP